MSSLSPFRADTAWETFAWLRVCLQSWWAGLLCKHRGTTQSDWCLPLPRAELNNKARPMEHARQILCFEPRGEVQLIYILCHSGEDKMFCTLSHSQSHREGGDLFTYRMGKKGEEQRKWPLESSTSWKPVLCNDMLGGERENTWGKD